MRRTYTTEVTADSNAALHPASFRLRRASRLKLIVRPFLERHVRYLPARRMVWVVCLIECSVGQKRFGKSLVIVEHQLAVRPLSVEIKIRPAIG
jgi:hypothetical protein